jgi:hypothetical protein
VDSSFPQPTTSHLLGRRKNVTIFKEIMRIDKTLGIKTHFAVWLVNNIAYGCALGKPLFFKEFGGFEFYI